MKVVVCSVDKQCDVSYICVSVVASSKQQGVDFTIHARQFALFHSSYLEMNNSY
jgi:hypothetical protein